MVEFLVLSALVVVGDGKGKFGYGEEKRDEVPVAIQKAMESARRNMIQVELKGTTLQHRLLPNMGLQKFL